MGKTMKDKKGSSGPLIASIIIILVLAVSGYYAIKERPAKTNMETLPIIEEEIANIEYQSTSTEISDIENDLGAFDFEDIGLDMEAADAEL